MAIKQDFVSKDTNIIKHFDTYADLQAAINAGKVKVGDICETTINVESKTYQAEGDLMFGTNVFPTGYRDFVNSLQIGTVIEIENNAEMTHRSTVEQVWAPDAFKLADSVAWGDGSYVKVYTVEGFSVPKTYVVEDGLVLKTISAPPSFTSVNDIEAYGKTDGVFSGETCVYIEEREELKLLSTVAYSSTGDEYTSLIYNGPICNVGDLLEIHMRPSDVSVGRSKVKKIYDIGTIELEDFIMPEDENIFVYKVNKINVAKLYTISDNKSIIMVEGVPSTISEDVDTLKTKIDSKAEKSQFFVYGTQTASTYVWKGNLHGVDKLYNGLVINYWLPFAGTSTSATLNLTLDDGTTTGAKNVYYGGTTRITTHLPAQTIGQFVYLENHKLTPSATTTYTGWWFLRSYLDGNTTYYVSTTGTLYTAGVNGIKQYSLFAENLDGTYESFITNSGTGAKTWYTNGKFAFNPHILYNPGSSNIASAGRTGTTYPIYHAIDIRYNTSNVSTTTGMTTHKSIYMPVTIGDNGEYWSPAGDWTQTPTAGNYYLYIGNCYSSIYQATISEVHNIYYCNSEGKLVNWQTEFYKPRYVKPVTHAEIMTVENSEMVMPDDVMHIAVKTYGWAGVSIYVDFEDGTASTSMTDWYSGNVEIKIDKTTLYDEDTIILTMINYPPYGSESSAIGNMFHYPATKKPSIRVKKKGSSSQEILVLHEKISGE